MDDVKALMETASDKAVSVTKGAIHKAQDTLEAAEKKLPEQQPTPEKPLHLKQLQKGFRQQGCTSKSSGKKGCNIKSE